MVEHMKIQGVLQESEQFTTLLRRVTRVVREFSDARFETHASSIAFFIFMSMIPVLVILACAVSVLGYTEQELIAMIGSAVPETVRPMIETMVSESYEEANLAIGVSTLSLFWSATKGSSAITRGLNAVYAQEERRSAIQVFLLSLVSVFALIIVVVAATYLIFSSRLVRLLSNVLPSIPLPGFTLDFLSSLFFFAMGTLVFSLCYTFLPSGKRRFVDQLPGAMLAALAWALLSYGFHFFVDSNTSIYALFYGSFATVTIFLFWMYCIFQILLFGGFFNRCRLEWRERERPQAHDGSD